MVAPTHGGEPTYLRATRDGYDAIAVGFVLARKPPET